MHWARPHVNPMLALRNIVCSDRWAAAWPQITQTLRQQARQQRTIRREKRRQSQRQLTPPTDRTPALPTTLPKAPVTVPAKPDPQSLPKPVTRIAAPAKPRRPAANHPWRRMPIGRARFNPPSNSTDAKS
jgi:hypothetical protein